MPVVTTASRIRDWLAKQDGRRTAGEIRAALALGSKDCAKNLHTMTKLGTLTKEGRSRAYTYQLGREPARIYGCESEAERAERLRISDRKRNAYKAAHRRAQTAKRRAAAPPKPAPAPKPARAAAPPREAPQRAPKPASARSKAVARVVAENASAERLAQQRVERWSRLAIGSTAAPQPAATDGRLMTSDEWLAANPANRIERLVDGEVSPANRLRRIGRAA